ncbi:MAG: hydroxyphenylacetyl-CoA thioesterase PaaI [Rhodospirillaceae bacterium]|jgi:acyl-CoA thioesterase|nr:hydroxyphenylacetyl-CoA thioesterase PaaI [Rhodospirillaceae bacterium]MBT4219869.1 hydroxyphenylacetyl-CoA thioesterase PaaI [Rhodospirillaceae bacterium]MBT4463359.1 hydroxyphenylacetyl-CoA thioesterase PaaI [Rhodospirillaceae bacterium]MBT5014292.1 hydroxyphenylacetyl-CoA thioesterase PaaI [Rhodospirillaceae bacterium]MBT5308309.1 hydroxyphenylacetyl-CoA thioesterase PaaI [Rhodospirillaceae bacterium]
MGDADNDGDIARTVAEEMYALDSAARGLGIVIDEVDNNSARVSMVVREDMLNSHRICHGGVMFTLADTAFAYACNSRNVSTLALSCSIDFVEAVALGEKLTAVAEKKIRKRRTGVYDVTVSNENGDTVAIFRGNSYQLKAESVPGLNDKLGLDKT